MSLSRLRKVFHKVSEPLINLLVALRVTPNMVTVSALFTLLPTIYFIINHNLVLAAVFMAITGLIDALDGAVANKVGSTRFGDYFDAVIDRSVEGMIYVAISVGYPEYYLICFTAFFLSYMVSYVAARAEVWTIGFKVKYTSIGSRAVRFVVMVASMLFGQLYLGLLVIVVIAFIGLLSRSFVTMVVLKKARRP